MCTRCEKCCISWSKATMWYFGASIAARRIAATAGLSLTMSSICRTRTSPAEVLPLGLRTRTSPAEVLPLGLWFGRCLSEVRPCVRVRVWFGFGLPRRYHGITATPPTQSSSTKKAASHLADGNMRDACRAGVQYAHAHVDAELMRFLAGFVGGPGDCRAVTAHFATLV